MLAFVNILLETLLVWLFVTVDVIQMVLFFCRLLVVGKFDVGYSAYCTSINAYNYVIYPNLLALFFVSKFVFENLKICYVKHVASTSELPRCNNLC